MSNQKKKAAVVLFNLGGPTSSETIQPFLFNFFMDKNIIPFLWPLRLVFAFLISRLRSRRAAGEAYGEMGGKSPLLENTRQQSKALQQVLDPSEESWRVFPVMRYWHPMADSVIPEIQAYAPDKVVLLSLYPQFSTTTAGSSYQAWNKTAQKFGLNVPTRFVCCYPSGSGFIKASTDKIRPVYEQARKTAEKNDTPMPRLLFSAHSLPLSVIQSGDPYEWQCKQTVKAILDELKIDNLDYMVCYQSKVGPQKWLGPQTEDCIKEAGKDGVPLVIYPHAFVSEHVETIVELGIEYREVAHECGVPDYHVVETVGDHPAYIDFLASLAKAENKNDSDIVCGHNDQKTPCESCPAELTRCCRVTYQQHVNCCKK